MSYDYYYTDDVEREIKNLHNGTKGQANYGLAVASMVVGIVSLVFFLFFINIILAIAAIIMAIVFLSSSAKGARGRGFATAGIITAILSIVFCIGSYVIIFSNADNISRMMQNEIDNNPQYHLYEDNGNGVDPFSADPFEDFDDFYEFYNNYNGIDGLENPDDLNSLPGQDDTL